MKIDDVLRNVRIIDSKGHGDVEINTIAFDSRKCGEHDAFFAVRGTRVDGHDFITKAVENGAKAIVCEAFPETLSDDVAYYLVENSAYALGMSASAFHG